MLTKILQLILQIYVRSTSECKQFHKGKNLVSSHPFFSQSLVLLSIVLLCLHTDIKTGFCFFFLNALLPPFVNLSTEKNRSRLCLCRITKNCLPLFRFRCFIFQSLDPGACSSLASLAYRLPFSGSHCLHLFIAAGSVSLAFCAELSIAPGQMNHPRSGRTSQNLRMIDFMWTKSKCLFQTVNY